MNDIEWVCFTDYEPITGDHLQAITSLAAVMAAEETNRDGDDQKFVASVGTVQRGDQGEIRTVELARLPNGGLVAAITEVIGDSIETYMYGRPVPAFTDAEKWVLTCALHDFAEHEGEAADSREADGDYTAGVAELRAQVKTARELAERFDTTVKAKVEGGPV